VSAVFKNPEKKENIREFSLLRRAITAPDHTPQKSDIRTCFVIKASPIAITGGKIESPLDPAKAGNIQHARKIAE
jgi:hypothetical protein